MSEAITTIRPAGSVWANLGADVRELWKYRAIILVLAGRQLRVRYKNSAIGVLWSLFVPLIQVFAITVALSILGAGPSNNSAFVLCAMLPWTFFSNAVLDGSSSILTYYDLMKKVYVPREVFPIASVLANLVHFFMALVVFILYRYIFMPIAFHGTQWPPREVLLFPVVLVIEIMFVLGITFVLSAWTTFYEDVKYLVATAMNVLIYILPVMWFAENIVYSKRIPPSILVHHTLKVWPRKLIYHLVLGDPLAWVITAFKQMFFAKQDIAPRGAPLPMLSANFDYRFFEIHLVFTMVILVAGYVYFNSRKWQFGERP